MATTTYGSPYVDGTDLVANWPAASLTVAQSIDAAGYYIGRGNNTQTGSYTTVLTDAGKVITMSNASANTVTIPANSSVAYVIGSRINILNLGAGACTPTAAAGVTINGTITALATNSSAAVIKTATNTWSYVPFGSGGAATLTSGDVSSTTGSPTITTSGIYTIYQFTGSGTIVLGKAGLCDVLVLGGGGGGGSDPNNNVRNCGGGGAGGYLTFSAYLTAATHTVTVGAGGAASNNQGGNDSGLGSYITAVGGGTGGMYNVTPTGLFMPRKGGSGGGSVNDDGSTELGASGVLNQGNAGGEGAHAAGSDQGAGGGGGAGAVGVNAVAGGGGSGGAGGAGSASSITGSSVTRGGGGGGRQKCRIGGRRWYWRRRKRAGRVSGGSRWYKSWRRRWRCVPNGHASRWRFRDRNSEGGDLMGHFALVDSGIVRNVICIANAVMDDLPFPESEPLGQAFIATLPDLAAQAGTWWECSYNNNFRGCYPGMGYGFDGVDFIPPTQPEPEPTPDDYTTQPEPVIEAP